MVYEGMAACHQVQADAFQKLLPLNASTPLPAAIQSCPLTNVSNCPVTEQNSQFVLIMYNPIGQNNSNWVRIPVRGNSYTVMDYTLNKVPTQLVPVTAATASLPDHMGSSAVNELVFQTSSPALGFSTYFVQETKTDTHSQWSKISTPLEEAADVVLKNEYISITFDGTSGLLKSLTNLERSLTTDLAQNLLYYKGFVGDNRSGANRTSGAYVFRPNGTDATPLAPQAMLSVVQGSEVQEVHQTFTNWASQVYRLYRGARHVEVEFTVGHIPVDDHIGKEIISRYVTSLDTQRTFYTDANGREVLKRVRDYRPTWDLKQTEPVSGNFYPINSRIYIQDVPKNMQLTILTDRSQGGGSIYDGELEIMIHRRLLADDSFGVDEPLNEPGLDGKGLYVRGKHYIIFDNLVNSVQHHREGSQHLYMGPTHSYIPTTMDPGTFSKQFRTTWSGLNTAVPPNVHLLTLEQWHSGFFLLRLEHFYAKGEHAVLSQPAQVSVKNLFKPFAVESLDEVTLGANELLSNATRLEWNVADYGRTQGSMKSFVTPVDPTTMVVILQPMQIRTFLVIIRENEERA